MIPHSKTTIRSADLKGTVKCLEKGFITAGNMNVHFRNKLQKFLNIDNVRLTGSGTIAWFKILIALGIKKDDEVLIPNYICSNILYPIIHLKAKPVLYDNANENWLSNFNEIEKCITNKTRIILVNHTFGIRFPDIEKMGKKYESIFVVEDCCHALTPNSKINGKSISTGSVCSFYSFNATKLIATGEGGAVTSNNSDFIKEYDKILIGDNLSDLNCSLGISQLKKLSTFLDKRKEIANRYFESFPDEILKIKDMDSVFFRLPVWTNKQSIFLSNTKISFKKGVDNLLSFLLKQDGYSNSVSAYNHTVSVPIYPSLKVKDIDLIIKTVCEIYDKN